MLEWLHRLLAGVVIGPLVLVIAVLSFRAREGRPRLPLYAGLLVLLLLVQAGLGGLTVLGQNSPWSVALHLGAALLFFSVLWLLWERAREEQTEPGAAGPAPGLAVLVWLLALATMVSAALVAKSGASLACTSWPLCDGALVPELADPLVRLNLSHRLLAAITTLGVLATWWTARRNGPARRPATAAFHLILAEVALGAVVVLLGVPVSLAVAHQALGVLVFAAISLVMWRCIGSPLPRQEPLHVRVSRARSAL
jgi:cytochrome c oxidase assembly protein subunit 15